MSIDNTSIYQWEVVHVHALYHGSGLIGGAIAPSTQVEAQRPIRRHHGVAWGGGGLKVKQSHLI